MLPLKRRKRKKRRVSLSLRATHHQKALAATQIEVAQQRSLAILGVRLQREGEWEGFMG